MIKTVVLWFSEPPLSSATSNLRFSFSVEVPHFRFPLIKILQNTSTTTRSHAWEIYYWKHEDIEPIETNYMTVPNKYHVKYMSFWGPGLEKLWQLKRNPDQLHRVYRAFFFRFWCEKVSFQIKVDRSMSIAASLSLRFLEIWKNMAGPGRFSHCSLKNIRGSRWKWWRFENCFDGSGWQLDSPYGLWLSPRLIGQSDPHD